MSDHRGRPMSTFFFDMFSTSSASSSFPKKVIGPDASEKVLGRPRGSGRPSWAFGGGPGGLLGDPGALRGGPGGILGGSWAVLGRSWSDFLSSSISDRFFDRFWSPKGYQKGGKLGAKIDQNRTQNESKFKTMFKSEQVGLQEPLGAVLGRSWDILDAILGSDFALRY